MVDVDLGSVPWFPYHKAWAETPAYAYAPLAVRGLVESAMLEYMKRGALPPTKEALQRAIGANDKEFAHAYPEAEPIIATLEPLWRAEMEKCVGRIQTNRENARKPRKPKDSTQEKRSIDQSLRPSPVQPAVQSLEPLPQLSLDTVNSKHLTDSPKVESSDTADAVSGSAEPKLTPFALIEWTLWGRAVRLAKHSGDDITDLEKFRPAASVVKRHLTGTTGLLPIIERLGHLDALDLLTYVARTQPGTRGYTTILDQLDVIRSQMKVGVDWVTRSRAPKTTPNLRGHLEVDLF